MKRLVKLMTLLGANLILCGCSAKSIVATVDPGKLCQSWREIGIRAGDRLTKETAADILGNNQGRESAGCEREPKPTKTPEPRTS
jgi:hypothetical protein